MMRDRARSILRGMSKAAKNYVIRGKDRVMSGPNLGLTMSVNDIEMYYEMRGEGEPLLLLYGGGGVGATRRPNGRLT